MEAEEAIGIYIYGALGGWSEYLTEDQGFHCLGDYYFLRYDIQEEKRYEYTN